MKENKMLSFSRHNILRICSLIIDICIVAPIVTLALILIGILIIPEAEFGPSIIIFLSAPFVILGGYVIGLMAIIDEAMFRDNIDLLLASIPIIAIPIFLSLLEPFLRSGKVKAIFIIILNAFFLYVTIRGFVDSTSAFAYLILFAINIVLAVFECILKGCTIGRNLLGIKLISKNNTNLTFVDYLYRAYFKNLGLFLWPLSFAYCLRKKETPWDTICDTETIKYK